ncbi:MFS transporter [Pseudomonas fluorescens group sp.]|uniref:Multidrug resistance protein n=2 Tax=Pseudomonas fluorescens TaxID=294 RepID=C3JZV6_PSEFS|nr:MULTISPECIES: MFS transporter [Pseudomonas fluorescens group]MBZ6457335.1 MFS transporter [Pseudomonas fluorescens group sp.]MBZ6462554.1 MFS transporter [Pseudomonas fluorescens group sp.]MBZ6470949.1 MFS transporter [Pseudomonas fluorescens group sp.]WQD70541.1 MFS transporter [Pseudomonas marginalis]CAI2798404.1 Putative multidrug resistance protein [Pseudomonas fluorescens SBW25]
MLTTLKNYPLAVNLLLGASLVLTLARAITLPYLVIYLSSQFQLGVADIGLVIGSSLIIGSLLSLYGGFLVDSLPGHRLILGCCAVFTSGFLGAFIAQDLWVFYVCLVAINLAYAVIDIAVKSGFGRLLPAEARSEAFSIKYTLTNIGYAVGPFLGAGLAALAISLPFLASAGLGAGFFMVYCVWGDRHWAPPHASLPAAPFLAVGKLLLRDYRLVCFTLGGILSAVVFGQFTAYLSQYLVVTTTPEAAYRIISNVVATNALMVISLQYTIGKRITHQHLHLWLAGGLGMFIVGLAGFGLSTSLTFWVVSMAIFTLGEIIVFPAEYMFIDIIAPDHLRGMYYGAQNLGNVGAALGPVLCGMVLVSQPAHCMFYLLALFVIAGGLLYCLGASLADKVHAPT